LLMLQEKVMNMNNQFVLKREPPVWSIVVFLGLITIISRLLFPSHILYHWDSVNFALSIEDFNLQLEQPHPPGYIFYVYFISTVNLIFNDPQITMVVISIVASVGSVILLYMLGRRMWKNDWVGFWSALFLAASPLFWFYGEIALPHTLDAFLVILCAWLLLRVRQGEHLIYPWAVISLAIAGGVRPQTLVFLAPLALFSLWQIGWRRLMIAMGIGFVVCLTWFISLMVEVGGLGNYLQVMGDFSGRFQSSTSIFAGAGLWGLRRNLIKLVLYTGYAVALAAVPLAITLLLSLINRQKKWDDENGWFLIVWMAPSLFFYTLIHMGQQGLVFVYLPALLLLAGYGVIRVARRLRTAGSRLLVTVMAVALILINTAIFLFIPEYPLGEGSQRFLTRDTINNSDAYYQERFAVIHDEYPADDVVILSSSWRHLQYYLPDYDVIPLTVGSKWELDENQASIDVNSAGEPEPDKEILLIFDPDINQYNQTPDEVELVETNGAKMYIAQLSDGNQLFFTMDSFGLR